MISGKESSRGTGTSICSDGYAGKNDLVQRMYFAADGKDPFYRKNVSTIFPDITADKLPGQDGKEITEDQYPVWRPHLSYIHAEGVSWRIRCTIETSDGYSGQQPA